MPAPHLTPQRLPEPRGQRHPQPQRRWGGQCVGDRAGVGVGEEGAAYEVGCQGGDFGVVLAQGVAVRVDLEAAGVAVGLLGAFGQAERQLRVGACVVRAVDQQDLAADQVLDRFRFGVRVARQPGGHREDRGDCRVAARAEGRAAAHAVAGQADRNVAVAAYDLVHRPFGVRRGVGVRGVPAAAAVVHDVGGEAVVATGAGQGTGQGEPKGVGERGGAAVRVRLAVREQQDHAADRGGFSGRPDGPSQPCSRQGECALCHDATVSEGQVYATRIRGLCYVSPSGALRA